MICTQCPPRRWIASAAVAVLLMASLGVASAFAGPSGLPRTVLVLYNSAEKTSAHKNIFAAGLQTAVNYYGFLVEYRDVAVRPLPDEDAMRDARAVFTIFNGDEMAAPTEYLRWLLKQFDAGRKVVVFGALGATKTSGADSAESRQVVELTDEVYKRLGLAYGRDFMSSVARLRFGFKRPGVMEFERKLPQFPDSYEKFTPLDPSFQKWLTVLRTDKPDSESTLVGVGPAGGAALRDYAYWQDSVDFRRQWYLDPFAFVKEALAVGDFPALTATTLNGMRVAFSHIDGDAFIGFTDLDKGKICADIIYEQILKKYDFPVSVSVIVAEIDPKLKGSPKALELARAIFRLPNVEPASHTYSHPFYWSSEDEVSDAVESVLLESRGYSISGYTFDPVKEIVYSTEYINKELAPADKPCKLLFWSGNCHPTEEHIALSDKAGLLNLNGGDTVFDAQRNSYFYVAPPYRPVGKRFQIYTGQANENILTNLWEGPFFGFSGIVETMKRTESPRRLAPIDVYYHFYSGGKHASLDALKQVYDWVLTQDTAPVFASAYVRMVMGSVEGQILRAEDGAYLIENYGNCLSLRFEEASTDPDLSRCENVLGFARLPQGLYVHLAPGKERARVAFGREIGGPQAKPYLALANGWVEELSGDAKKLLLRMSCYGKGKVALAGMQANSRYVARTGGAAVMAQSDKQGSLSLVGLENGAIEVELQ